jgi:hypothetical protein
MNRPFEISRSTLLVLLLLMPAAASAQQAPAFRTFQDAEEARTTDDTRFRESLHTDICNLGPSLRNTCGPAAAQHLQTICDGGLELQPATLAALKPFLVRSGPEQCSDALLTQLATEAATQARYPLCAHAKAAKARCGGVAAVQNGLPHILSAVCQQFSVDDSSRDALLKVLQGIAQPGACTAADIKTIDQLGMTFGSAAAAKAVAAATADTVEAPALPSSTDWQSMLLHGLTTFLVDRAHVETAAYVVDTVAGTFCTAKDGTLSVSQLFEETCSLVQKARDSKLVLIPGRMLYQVIRTDLQALPERLTLHLPATTLNQQAVLCGLVLVTPVGHGLTSRQPPLQLAFGTMRTAAETPSCQAPLGLDTTGKTRWLELTRAVEALGVELLGADEQKREAWMLNPNPLIDFVVQVVDPLMQPEIRTALTQVTPLALRLQTAVAVLRKRAAAGEGELTALRDVTDATVQLLDGLLAAGIRLRPGSTDVNNTVKALRNALTATSRFFQGDFAGGLTRLISSDVLPADREPYKTVLEFSPFLTELSEAKTSDEVAAAFEVAAAPVGSWRLKRKKLTLGLGARVGALAAYEDPTGGGPAGFTLGTWIPVGLDGSMPAGASTVGLFLHAIDVGALGTARLTDFGGGDTQGKARIEPKVGFVQVVSPGAALYWGIGRSPFVLSLGVSLVPALRNIERDGAPEEEVPEAANVWRVGLGLGVDIPLFIR